MVRLLAGSSIRVSPIRPTVVKPITPAEIKIMSIIWSALKSLLQGVPWGLCGNKGVYWLTCVVFVQSQHCTCTHLEVFLPSARTPLCHLSHSLCHFNITQTGPADMLTEILSENARPWPFFFNPPQMKHVGMKAGQTSRACSEQRRPGIFNSNRLF